MPLRKHYLYRDPDGRFFVDQVAYVEMRKRYVVHLQTDARPTSVRNAWVFDEDDGGVQANSWASPAPPMPVDPTQQGNNASQVQAVFYRSMLDRLTATMPLSAGRPSRTPVANSRSFPLPSDGLNLPVGYRAGIPRLLSLLESQGRRMPADRLRVFRVRKHQRSGRHKIQKVLERITPG